MDSIPKTLTIIKSQHNQIFGGYACPAFNSSGSCIAGQGHSFLFSLTKNTKLLCLVPEKELNGNSYGYGPVFGFGKDTSDLAIIDQSDKCNESNSFLGNSYEVPQGMIKGSLQAKRFLAGSLRFRTLEIEVH